MRFVYRLEPRDYQAVVEAIGLRRRFGQPPDWLWYLLGALNFLLTALWWRMGGLEMMLTHIYTLAIAVFSVATPYWYRAHMRRAVRRDPAYGHEIVVDLAERGIVASYGETMGRFEYASIRSVDERPGHLLLWIAKRLAIILPKRGLADGTTIAAVRDHVEERRKAMMEGEGTEAVTGAASRTPWVRRGGDEPVFEKTVTPTFEDHLAVDFADGRLMGPTSFVVGAGLAGLAVASYRGFDRWQAGEPATLALFMAAGLAISILAGYLAFLLVRWAATRIFAMGMRGEGAIDRPIRMRFDCAGLEGDRSGMLVNIPWETMVDVEADDHRFFFWISTTQAASIRRDAFCDPAELAAFEAAITRWYGRAPRTPPRMACERSLPPGAAGDPMTDNR